MQSERRAIKRGNAVRYNNGFQIKFVRKKGTNKQAWKFAVKNKVDL